MEKIDDYIEPLLSAKSKLAELEGKLRDGDCYAAMRLTREIEQEMNVIRNWSFRNSA